MSRPTVLGPEANSLRFLERLRPSGGVWFAWLGAMGGEATASATDSTPDLLKRDTLANVPE